MRKKIDNKIKVDNMKMIEVAKKASLLTSSRSKIYNDLKKDNIFYYFVDSLVKQYQDYVKMLNEEELVSGLDQHGFWVGDKTRKRFLNLIKHISKRSMSILATCYTGDIWEAGRQLSYLLCDDRKVRNYLIEPFADSFKTEIDTGACFYRMRDSKDKVKDCWHTPYNLRKLTVNYRYSLAGFPCLYLANSVETANKELGRLKAGNRRWVSTFCVNKTNVYFDLKILREVNLKSMDKVELVNYLLTFPIRILCSIPTNNKDTFHEEYYFPQLMMYCLCVSENKNIRKFDGITYSSTKQKDGINYVLPARYKGKRPPIKGQSPELLKAFTASSPIIFK